MSDEIIKVLDAIGDKFGIMIDWTQQNVQPYIQDLCQRVTQYKLTTNIVGLVITIFLLAVGTIWLIYTINTTTGYKNRYSLSDDDKFTRQIICFIASPIMILIGLIATITLVDNICMCLFIPEKVLINELQSIL